MSTYIPDPLEFPIEIIIADRINNENEGEEFLVKYKGLSYLEVEWI